MFYEGDLQNGIAEAIKQAKVLACFVRDDEKESGIWENDYLKDSSISSLLEQKALLLRLQAGSQEAGYLAALHPLPTSPTLVMIQSNGQLKEYLAAGVIKSNFLDRVKAALDNEPVTRYNLTESTPSEGARSQQLDLATSSNNVAIGNDRGHVAEETHPQRNALNGETAEQQEAGEGDERYKKAAVEKELLRDRTSPDAKKVAGVEYALMQKKRREDARKDRERILKRVEDDKMERRKAREALHQERVQGVSDPDEFIPSKFPEKNSTTIPLSIHKQSTACALQVRLFDGTTKKSRFQPDDTLRSQVRSWVDSHLVDNHSPYTFKQILTPQSNRTITISEEEESLQSLGLTPSATFVLVAIKEYTTAYDGENGSSISRMISGRFLTVSSSIQSVTGMLYGLFGGVTAPRTRPEQATTQHSAGTATTDIWTVEDDHVLSEDNLLYNGNALNFEPRRDMGTED